MNCSVDLIVCKLQIQMMVIAVMMIIIIILFVIIMMVVVEMVKMRKYLDSCNTTATKTMEMIFPFGRGTIPLTDAIRAVRQGDLISSFLTLINEPRPGGNGNGDGNIDGNIDGGTNARGAMFARKLELLCERNSNLLVQMARGAYQLRELIHRGEIMQIGGRRLRLSSMIDSSTKMW